MDVNLGLSIKDNATKERFHRCFQDCLLSRLEVVRNGLAEGRPIAQVTFLGRVGGVPGGFEGKVYGIWVGVLGHPVLADSPPERMIARPGDTHLLGKAEGMFVQGL